MGKKRGYSSECESMFSAKARITSASVHFKNTVETANAINGMTVKRAIAYLKNVLAHTECVPFRKYKGGIGHCAQAKAFKTTLGRWPQKSVKLLLDVVKNAVSNAEFKGLDCETLKIVHIQVNAAPLKHRRTFRAHGRITPYMGHHCHVELILHEPQH